MESVITKMSAARSSWCRSSSCGRVGDPISSSPSTNTVTPIGGFPPNARSEAALVVGYAAAVESPAVLSCDVGRSTPVGRVPLGLDVVMGVETNGRHAFRSGKPAENSRRAVTHTDYLDIWAVHIRQELHYALRTRRYLCSPRRIGAHRLDRDKGSQIVENAWKLGVDLITK